MGLPVDCSYQPNLESYMTLNEDEYQKSIQTKFRCCLGVVYMQIIEQT